MELTGSFDFAVLAVPARIANLAFRLEVPRDWNLHDLPDENVDFGVPTNFFPLAVLTAPWAAVALTVAVRPAFENGTLQDASLFLLEAQGIRPTALALADIGNAPGLAGAGRQQQDGAGLEVRFAFFEDGGRLVHLGLLAPDAISALLEPVWRRAMNTFHLETPQGQSIPVGPGMGICPEPAARPGEPEWWQRAQQLDREDRLAEAEQLLLEKIPHIHSAIQIAEMYRLRWIRLQTGDPVQAGAARKQAARWAGIYAASATSGGEGVALSHERDQFLRTLGPEPF